MGYTQIDIEDQKQTTLILEVFHICNRRRWFNLIGMSNGGWEKWLQCELNYAYGATPNDPQARREQPVYGQGNLLADFVISTVEPNGDGVAQEQTLVVELKCYTMPPALAEGDAGYRDRMHAFHQGIINDVQRTEILSRDTHQRTIVLVCVPRGINGEADIIDRLVHHEFVTIDQAGWPGHAFPQGVDQSQITVHYLYHDGGGMQEEYDLNDTRWEPQQAANGQHYIVPAEPNA
ncbi:hypothetical protein JJD41_21645 [Oxynema sp. CENA135]|uniref:hypothetical protein n=1 Tax=Oxynema sp. CENA135 TaxID=984206 RepID=UPI00190D3107|nr:hypothetical protein [Oxynema sp. CENA135]MBK4732446.1 hypothetical protein [Oxynema sp. CENA135]